jgi:hypothetical protein
MSMTQQPPHEGFVNLVAWCRGELDKKRPLLSMLRHSGTFLRSTK